MKGFIKAKRHPEMREVIHSLRKRFTAINNRTPTEIEIKFLYLNMYCIAQGSDDLFFTIEEELSLVPEGTLEEDFDKVYDDAVNIYIEALKKNYPDEVKVMEALVNHNKAEFLQLLEQLK